MKRLALFASGSGTNVEQIAQYLANNKVIKVDCVIVNRKNAFVRQRAQRLGVADFYFTKEDFESTTKVLELLKERQIDFIALCGFLLLVPQNIVSAFEGRIVNIHPALIPKYCGKGMYGENVHKAVLAAGEKESGITIHYVNTRFDEGDIIAQYKCQLNEKDTLDTLEEKIHLLEKEYYPKVLEKIVSSL